MFSSPQFIVNHDNIRDVFIQWSHCTTLWVVVLDEVHIHIQHGTSFCCKIHVLQAIFFAKTFGNQPAMEQPWLTALMATMPNSYLPLLSDLLTINSFADNALIHGSSNNFSQCKIEMQSYITSNKGQYVLQGLSFVSKNLQDSLSLSTVVFCNSRKQLQYFCNHLEQKLTKMTLNINVIHINGLLHKIDKFSRICMFCDETHIKEADFRVLVRTNSANVVIEKSSNALQMRFDWPCDLLTYFQKQGRRSWQKGSKSVCILYAVIYFYVSLVLQLLGKAEGRVQENATSECDGVNLAILPRRKSGKQTQDNLTLCWVCWQENICTFVP